MEDSNNFSPDELPLHIPRPKRSTKTRGIINRLVAFSTCSLIIVIFVYFCLVLAHMVQLGVWATLHHSLEHTLPRTFAWEVIIQLFGSTYDDCADHTGPKVIQMVTSDSCKYYHSPPLVSILAMALQVAQILCGIFYPLEKYIFRANSNMAFKLMLLSSILTVIFTVRNVTMHCLYIGRGDSNFETVFEKLMREEMKPLEDSPLHISKKWEITQEANQCCGLHNFTDWKFHMFQDDLNPRYPWSCCDKTKSLCHIYPSRSTVYENGCLAVELERVHEYAIIAIGLSFLALLTSLLFVFLVYLMDTIYLPQHNAGDPTKSCTKIIFTRHANNPTLKTDEDKKDMCLFSSKFPKKSESSHSAKNNLELQNLCHQLKGAGDDTGPQHKPRSAFTLNRKSTTHVSVNSWGIASRTETSSVAKTLILRKETAV